MSDVTTATDDSSRQPPQSQGEGAPGEPRFRESPPVGPEAPRKELTPAAQRALAEAEERRRAAEARAKAEAEELGGRGGLDPVRYGDWEIKGIAYDF